MSKAACGPTLGDGTYYYCHQQAPFCGLWVYYLPLPFSALCSIIPSEDSDGHLPKSPTLEVPREVPTRVTAGDSPPFRVFFALALFSLEMAVCVQSPDEPQIRARMMTRPTMQQAGGQRGVQVGVGLLAGQARQPVDRSAGGMLPATLRKPLKPTPAARGARYLVGSRDVHHSSSTNVALLSAQSADSRRAHTQANPPLGGSRRNALDPRPRFDFNVSVLRSPYLYRPLVQLLLDTPR